MSRARCVICDAECTGGRRTYCSARCADVVYTPSGRRTLRQHVERELFLARERVSVGFDAAYAVLGWDEPARTIAGTAAVGCGAYSVADPRDTSSVAARVMSLDEAQALEIDASKPPPFVPVIIAADGTWHRPLTLLELAVLQGYPAEMHGGPIVFTGGRTAIAEHIGNSVPIGAAQAIAERMLVSLVEASVGAMSLSSGAVWVRPDAREVRA